MSQSAFPGGLSREDPDLNDRQRTVFLALVESHGRTARPVGSEALSGRPGLRLSPASIRSALGELESMGLVQRAHASSGRVPSTPGYAFFVRTQVTPAELPPALVLEIEETLRRSARDVEHLLGEASRLLSSVSRQLGLALTASLDAERLSSLELAPLDDRRALLVLGLGGGAVRTLVLELESPLDGDDLAEVEALLRERLVGRMLLEVRERLASDPELVRASAVRMVARAAARGLEGPVTTARFSSGAGRIAAQPEFQSGGQLGPLLRLVENGPPLDRLMIDGIEGMPGVRVGLDEDRALSGLSLVSFPLPGALRGAVGVLGPQRMDYARVLAVVDLVGRRVADLL